MFARFLFALIGLSFSFELLGQTLTISSAANSGTYSYSAGTLTVSASSNIQASQIQTWLASGDLSIVGSTSALTVNVNQAITSTVVGSDLIIGLEVNTGTINIDANLTIAGGITLRGGTVQFDATIESTQTGAPIQFLSKGQIVNTALTTINTQGGAILFAADTDNNATGNIYIPYTFTMDSNGGDITLAGGDFTGSGYARGSGNDFEEGIDIRGTTSINSDGGNITLRGKSDTGAASVQGIYGVGFWGATTSKTIHAGSGTILIEGISYGSDTTNDYNYGVAMDGTTVTIVSANNTSSAIVIKGSNAFGDGTVDGRGIDLRATNTKIYATETGGGIRLEGGGYYGFTIYGTTEILAKSGPIQLINTIDGVEKDIYLNGSLWLGSKAATSVTTSSSNILIQADDFSFVSSTTPYIGTTGTFTFEPVSTSASFDDALSSSLFAWNQNSQTLSGLTLGKVGNATDITLAAVQTVAGPISIYGGDIAVNQNLTSTLSGADILLQATGAISLAASKVIQTTGGDITFKATANGVGTTASNAIFLDDGSDLLSNGGNITLGGGYSGTQGNLYAATTISGGGFALRLDLGVGIQAAGGNVLLYGRNVSSYGDGIYLDGVSITTTGSGTIGLYGDSHGGYSSGTPTYFGGITFDNRAATIQTVDGNITIEGILTGSQSTQGYAINFYRNPGTTGQTKHIQFLSQTGDIQLTANRGSSIGNGIGHSSWGDIYFGSPANNSFTASGDIKLSYSDFVGALNNGFKVKTTGNVTYEPAAGSFDAAQTFPLNVNHILANGASSLTIGKDGNTSDITIGSNQSVAGYLQIYGGTITLGGNIATTNTTTGNILLQATSLSGTGNIGVAAGRTASINVSSSTTYEGIISGAGSNFTKLGAGSLTLTKDHTYTGATNINAGDLQVGTGGSVSQASSGTIATTSQVVIENGSKLILSPNENMTFAAPISGAGGVEIKGASGLYYNSWLTTTATQMVANASVLEVLTRITGGKMGGSAVTGAPVICGAYQKVYNASNNTATLQFQAYNGTSTVNYTKCVFVKLSQSGSNVMIQANNAIYSTGAGYKSGNVLGTDISSGGNSQTLSTSGGNGYGVSEVFMSGKVNFTGALSYSGNTLLSNTISSLLTQISGNVFGYSYTSKGTQEITDASSAFPAASTVVNNGLVIFNRATATTIASALSGTEEVLQVGAPITLSGTCTHTGLTTIDLNKSLIVGNGSTAGSMTGNVLNYGTLTFSRSDNSSYPGVISGSGTLVKSGAGEHTLTGLHTFTGATTISAGKLVISRDVPAFSSSSISGAGELVIQPTSTSFTNAVSYPIAGITVGGIGGLTLGKSGNLANITFASATSIAGPISAYGGQINVNANLTSTAASSVILLKATNRIELSSGTASNSLRTIQTNNGNIVLWSNSAGGTSGGIRIGDWSMLNTANGSSTQTTGGGKIWLAGGTTLDASNLPTSAAIGTGNSWTGIGLGSFGGGATTNTLYSGGGDIYLCGESSVGNGLGISWNRSGVCNAGAGSVRMIGDSKTSTGGHGIEISGFGGNVDIISSGGDANNPAIYLKGSTERTADFAAIQTSSGAFKATGSGGIYIEGSTPSTNTNYDILNIGMDILAASGPISLIASGGKGLRYIGTIGRKDGSTVPASSSNVLISSNSVTVNSALAVQTTGILTIEPNSTSFTSAFSWPISSFNVAGITGLTLGKSGNAVSMTISSAQSIPGPITIYGGTLNLNANLTTTSANSTASNISLNGTTISGTPTLTLSTGSTLTMNLSSNTNFAGPIVGTNLGFVKNGAGTLSLTAATALNFVDFTISGGTYKLNSNQQLTLSNSLTNNGTFLMKSGATFVPSATVTNVTGTGTFTVEKLLTGNESNWNTSTNNGRFWYMGIPVNSAPRSSFGSHNTTSNRLFSYSETTKTYTSLENNTATLSGGTGYVHRRTTNDTLTFTGVGANGLRGAAFNQNGMTRTSGASVGFHLVANPYMAYVDWDAVTKTNIESTYYIRSAATGNISALISYNSVGPNYVNGGVTTVTNIDHVRYLAPMQAFWVRVGSTSTTGSLGMNTGMLSHQTTNPGLKNTSIFPTLARVNLVDGARFDQMLVFMNQDMTNGVDAYDSEKMFVSGNPQLYTMAAGKKLVMNGLNSNKKKISVPLYLELPESKVYNLQLADYNLEDGLILLEDKLEGTIQDFTIHDTYAFYANSGVLQNRFVLHFYAPDNGITAQGPSNSWVAEEASYTEGGNILISSDPKGKVQISLDQPETDKVEGTVQASDANGRVVYSGALEGLITEFQLNVPSGVYYLTVQSGNIIENKKVFIQE